MKVGDIITVNGKQYVLKQCGDSQQKCCDKCDLQKICANQVNPKGFICSDIILRRIYFKEVMETPKEIKIQVPEGMEIDRENSTFECIKFKPKGITYKDIQKRFQSICSDGERRYGQEVDCHYSHRNKLAIYRQLLEVAEYLNDGWKFDSNGKEVGYMIHSICGSLEVCGLNTIYGIPVFKTSELARQAIEIIGENYLKILFS